LVTGISGQTGAYLARQLLSKGYRVVGTSRDSQQTDLWRLKRLGIDAQVVMISLDTEDSKAVRDALETHNPEEIFHLTGPSSVGQSFEQPSAHTLQIINPVLNVLEALRLQQSKARFVNSSSTDCFGNQPDTPLDETSPFIPVSPYGIAKASTHWLTQLYRRSFGVSASNAILTNHESPLRGEAFVTHKIVKGLKEVKAGRLEQLELGNTAIARDWLWADDVAHALSLIASSETADDYLVASGKTHTLMELVSLVCLDLGLEVSEVVSINPELYRPADIKEVLLNPKKIKTKLEWSPAVSFQQIVNNLVREDTR